MVDNILIFLLGLLGGITCTCYFWQWFFDQAFIENSSINKAIRELVEEEKRKK